MCTCFCCLFVFDISLSDFFLHSPEHVFFLRVNCRVPESPLRLVVIDEIQRYEIGVNVDV